MSWIKATDKYPEDWQLCRIIGTDKKFPAMFATHVIADFSGKTYKKDQIEWLDTEEPSFSISDIGAAWKHCCELWEERSGRCIPPELFHKYLIDKYNIDVDIN